MPDHDRADQSVTRAVPHPKTLNPRGIAITCAACGAARDWLLIQVRNLIFVRCRCAHEWQEHDLGAGEFDGSYRGPETEWDSFEQMYCSLGFDGLFRGCYLAGRIDDQLRRRALARARPEPDTLGPGSAGCVWKDDDSGRPH